MKLVFKEDQVLYFKSGEGSVACQIQAGKPYEVSDFKINTNLASFTLEGYGHVRRFFKGMIDFDNSFKEEVFTKEEVVTQEPEPIVEIPQEKPKPVSKKRGKRRGSSSKNSKKKSQGSGENNPSEEKESPVSE